MTDGFPVVIPGIPNKISLVIPGYTCRVASFSSIYGWFILAYYCLNLPFAGNFLHH